MTAQLANLPLDHAPRTYLQGTTRVLRCCHRNVEVRASEEEKIRQVVLHSLLTKQASRR
jgi:hypothetical protein